MKTIKNIVACLLFIIPLTFGSFSQENKNKNNLNRQEMVLQNLFDSLANANDDETRIKVNNEIKTLLGNIVDNPESFEYPFDSIKNAGILTSPDKKLRLYNWNLPYENGVHEYYCFIQYKPNKKKQKILNFELKDVSENIEEPEQSIINYPDWYGALYYKIIPIETRFNEKYYTLLAYDMNDFLTNKKIVEVLRFDKDNKPIFGASIFKNRRKISNRLIFEYSEFASMILEYEEDKEMIVYDHLSPSSPKYEGQYEFYGPDFSYDGLKYEKGIWNTYYDLDLRLNKINIDD